MYKEDKKLDINKAKFFYLFFDYDNSLKYQKFTN